MVVIKKHGQGDLADDPQIRRHPVGVARSSGSARIACHSEDSHRRRPQDLGTAFDVRLRPDGVSVAVNQGSVAVTSPTASQALATPLVAGDWVRVEWGGAVRCGSGAPELAGGWRSGMLAVEDEAMSDVIDEIGRHYRGKIVIPSGELGGKRVTGVYDLNKPIDTVHAVARALGACVRQASCIGCVSRYCRHVGDPNKQRERASRLVGRAKQ